MGKKLKSAIDKLETMVEKGRVSEENVKKLIKELKELNQEKVDLLDTRMFNRPNRWPEQIKKRNCTYPDDINISYHHE